MRRRSRSGWLPLAAAALLLSCSGAPPAPGADARAHTTASHSPSVPATSAAPSAAAPPSPDQQLAEKLQQALAYVSGLRGLSIKSPVKGRLIGRSEIRAYIEQLIDSETPKDVMQSTEALLIGLRTVPLDFDFRESVLTLMSAQLLGFYDPEQKTFFVGGDLVGQEADVTLWHELVHALQDQHYDLAKITKWQPDMGDSLAAVHSLAEGDATSAMLDGVMKPKGGTALDLPESLLRADSVFGAAAASAPPVLVRSLVAPYLDGLVFTHFLRRRGGFAAVDEAWRAPPVSTEQLLHPEKYLAAEAPVVVPVPPPPPFAPELAERYRDVVGEQSLRVVLEEWMPARTAALAASDWGGDRVAVFSDEARARWAVAWHLRYDTGAAAERALLAFARGALLPESTDPKRPAGYVEEALARSSLKRDKMCLERHRRGPIAVVRRGKDLAVTVGVLQRNSVAPPTDTPCAAILKWAETIATN